MATILDQLRKSQPQVQLPGMQDQTEQAANLLRAKVTGKSLAPSAIQVSSLPEEIAVQGATRKIQNEIAPQIQGQTQQLVNKAQAVEQQGADQRASLMQTQKYNTLQNRIQTNSILNDLARNKDEINTARGKQALEQAGFLLNLQDKDYVTKLQQVGDKRRLDQKFNMLNEMQDLVFGEEVQLFKDKLATDNILYANKRDYSDALSKMGIQDAIKIAQIEAQGREVSAANQAANIQEKGRMASRTAQIRGMYSGMADTVSTGTRAWYEYNKDKPTSTPTTTTGK